MSKKIKVHMADIFSTLVFIWAGVVLMLNWVIPTGWYFEYQGLETTDVCAGEYHTITGTTKAKFAIDSEGVDQIIDLDGVTRGRLPWDKGHYEKGIDTGAWDNKANLFPGQYYWENTILRITLFKVFPVYLNEEERPRSNVFTVKECV